MRRILARLAHNPLKIKFTLKEKAYKNSFVITGNIASKEENWKSISVPKYLRISRKHAHVEFFQQTTPQYLRKGPHNSVKVTEIIDTSDNKGEDGLQMMAELASQRVVLLGPKHNQWVSGVSDL